LDVVVGFLLVFGFVLVVVLDEALRYAAYTVDKAGTSLRATSAATSFENEKNAHDTSEATPTVRRHATHIGFTRKRLQRLAQTARLKIDEHQFVERRRHSFVLDLKE
jgi:L-amino acid N-acyltransferase YncA